jgi:hypothetical protein
LASWRQRDATGHCKSKKAMVSATIATISAKTSVLIPLVDRNRGAREGMSGVLSGVPGTFWMGGFQFAGMTIHGSNDVRLSNSRSLRHAEGKIGGRYGGPVGPRTRICGALRGLSKGKGTGFQFIRLRTSKNALARIPT